jgi:hypothetical protein
MSSEPTSNESVMAWFSKASSATLGVIAVVVIVVIVFLAMWIGGTGPFGQSVSGSWSAVFLTDSEVFFGHVKSVNNDQVDLVNVYYLQRSQATQTNTSSSTAPTQLAILGLVANQIQCPTDEIVINRQSVLNIQTLQSSSFVVSKLNQLVKQSQKCFAATAATATPAATAAPSPSGKATPSASASASASASPSSSASASPSPTTATN